MIKLDAKFPKSCKSCPFNNYVQGVTRSGGIHVCRAAIAKGNSYENSKIKDRGIPKWCPIKED